MEEITQTVGECFGLPMGLSMEDMDAATGWLVRVHVEDYDVTSYLGPYPDPISAMAAANEKQDGLAASRSGRTLKIKVSVHAMSQ